ncbi:MAG: hypothetical protein EXX96DRAFT_584495 [Benjaminiella poitrasii]|nr:MAG: hypothetical protein EXX96DRAFT_584495 [Benjaminiella poitrasii]
MSTTRNSLITATFALLLSSMVNAHVTLSPKFVEPDQNITTAFHVPHGCNGSSTTSIFVTVPESITILTPEQVVNWTLSTTYRDADNTIIDTITWSGGVLKPTDALDFPMNLTVPSVDLSTQSNVTFYFPVIQTCEVGTSNWTGIGTTSGDEEPAPSLVVVNNATQAAADATKITSNSTSSGSHSQPSASGTTTGNSDSGASSVYASLLPALAVIASSLAIVL